MKRTWTVVAVVLLMAVTAGISAQEAEGTTPLFVRNMVRTMAAYGWNPDELARFAEACEAYQWEGLNDVDPRTLMVAMRFSWERGESEEGLSLRNRAAIANALAYQSQEMTRLGMDDRDVALVVATATRESLQTRTMTEAGNPVSDAERIRERLREATDECLQELNRERERAGNENGNTTRFGDDTEPGVPAGPPVNPPSNGGSGPKGHGN